MKEMEAFEYERDPAGNAVRVIFHNPLPVGPQVRLTDPVLYEQWASLTVGTIPKASAANTGNTLTMQNITMSGAIGDGF